MAASPALGDAECGAATPSEATQSTAPHPDAPATPKNKQRTAELALAGVCVVWGSSFVICKRAFEDSSPLVFTTLRYLVALAALIPIYWKDLRKAHVPGALAVGLLLFVGFTLQAAGLARTTASRSAFITALCIPLTPIFQSALLRRRPRLMDVLGAFIAATGVALLTNGGGGGDDDAGSAALNAGDWLTLACAVVFALHMIALNHWGAGPGFATTAVGQVAVTAVLSAVFCDAWEKPVLRVSGILVLAILVTGLLATALAFTVLAWAQTHTSATRAAIICSTESMFAAIFSWLVYGEVLTGLALLGAFMILLSMVMGEMRLPPLPPPPGWLPPPARALWVRTRDAQLSAAAAAAAAAGAAPAEGEPTARDVELSEHASLLGAAAQS